MQPELQTFVDERFRNRVESLLMPNMTSPANVEKALDALGNATSFDLPTAMVPQTAVFPTPPHRTQFCKSDELRHGHSVTNAAGQVSNLQYDFYLGRPVDAQDAKATIYRLLLDNDALESTGRPR